MKEHGWIDVVVERDDCPPDKSYVYDRRSDVPPVRDCDKVTWFTR